ncbi:MAG: type II toxin-antitoxin system VapC family toxin [Geminicoccaceae bacterium]
MPLIDTNILFDLITNDPIWGDWSLRQIESQALQDRLVINPVVYAELSVSFDRPEEVDAFLGGAGIEVDEMPRPALFLAGKAFQTYRARGGTKTGVLSDFFIGAHAVVEGISLLTRDSRRYRSYFPAIVLITPGDA